MTAAAASHYPAVCRLLNEPFSIAISSARYHGPIPGQCIYPAALIQCRPSESKTQIRVGFFLYFSYSFSFLFFFFAFTQTAATGRGTWTAPAAVSVGPIRLDAGGAANRVTS